MENKSVTPKKILELALPAIIAGIAEPVISVTDLAVIGNMEENAVVALSAVGLVGSFLSAIIWTLAQTKTSISSIVSNALGDGSLSKINQLIPQVIWLNIFAGLLLYAITAPLSQWIFTLYKATDETLSFSVNYYQIRAIGFPITLCSFALFGIFRGLQNTSWAMIASLTAASINIGLDILLVHGWKDVVPEMGIEGAAYASLIAQSVMLLIALFFFYHKTDFSFFKISSKPHKKLKKHLGLTLNFFLRTAAINIAIYLSYRYANNYGVAEAAAHAILMNVWLFFSFFIDGFANAGNAIGGKLLGARDLEGLKDLGSKTTVYGVGVALILSLCCFLGYNLIPQLFTDDSSVLEVLSQTFWIVLLMQPINAIAFVYDGIFKGWGEAVYLRNLLFTLTLAVFIPSLLIGDYFEWQLSAIWAAFFFWMIGRALVLKVKFNRRLSDFQNE